MSFQSDVVEELKKVREKHGKMASAHEGFGVLYEEVWEFFDEVRKKSSKRNLKNMYKELVQIAAVAQRTAEDLISE